MSDRDKGFRLTGKHVLAGFIVFFGVIIAVDVVFVRLAVRSFPGEETKKSYYQGLQYNDVLDAKARQSESGWRMQLLKTPSAGSEPMIEVRLVDDEGQPIFDADITGEIVRPTTEAGRQKLSFYLRRDGIYRADLQTIEEGAWDFSVAAVRRQEPEASFTAKSRIIVR
jgi:nitrogen fixation protein FixH